MRCMRLFSATLLVCAAVGFGQNPASTSPQQTVVNQYCSGCHNDKVKSGGFSWTKLDLAHPDQQAEQAEKAIRKLRAGMMPPAGAPRPEAAKLQALAVSLEN